MDLNFLSPLIHYYSAFDIPQASGQSSLRSSAVGLVAPSKPDSAFLSCHDGPKAASTSPSTPSSPLPNAPFPLPSHDTSSLGIRGKTVEGSVRQTTHSEDSSAPGWPRESSTQPYQSLSGLSPLSPPAAGLLQQQRQVDPHKSPPIGPYSGLRGPAAAAEGERVGPSGNPHLLAAWMPATAAWWESKPAVTSSPLKSHGGAAT